MRHVVFEPCGKSPGKYAEEYPINLNAMTQGRKGAKGILAPLRLCVEIAENCLDNFHNPAVFSFLHAKAISHRG